MKIKYTFLIVVLLLFPLSGCRIFVYPVSNTPQELKAFQNSMFENHIKSLNRQLLDQALAEPICNFDLMLELIAKSQGDYKNIHVNKEAGDQILKFLTQGYDTIKKSHVTFANADEMEKKLKFIVGELFSEAAKKDSVVSPDLFESLRKIKFCPIYPFC